jgi:hypothetical protein
MTTGDDRRRRPASDDRQATSAGELPDRRAPSALLEE